MYLEHPPAVIDSTVFTTMPAHLRRPERRTSWAQANKGGRPVDCFLEGPTFDSEGNLYVVDIPHGRIFRISPAGEWVLVVAYDGEPNGLALHPDGRILVADHRRGLLQLDPRTAALTALLERRNAEAFKGVNDLIVSRAGDVYFTDQGQTGLHDPSGRVFRLSGSGRLDCLMSNLPSPNGLVLDEAERVLFVAMTRDNAIWRAPLQDDGSVSKVGRFATLFGTSGPDGLALDEAGRIACAHASLGQVFLFAPNGELVVRVRSAAGPTCTNLAYGGPGRTSLFVTESATGSILRAELDVAGSIVPGLARAAPRAPDPLPPGPAPGDPGPKPSNRPYAPIPPHPQETR